MVTAMSEWGKGIMESASMASDITGYSAWVIRKWAFEYFSAISIFSGSLDNIDNEFIDIQLSSNRGSSIGNQSSIIQDEEFKISAREFVRSNGYKKGEPNLTAHDFKSWIEDNYDVTICTETARVWLHLLGFSQKSHQKGIFFDGHDRSDVVEEREKFLDALEDFDKLTVEPGKPLPYLDPGQKHLLRVVHDESTFYANADQSQFWSDGEQQLLRQKSLGQSIMVSDFIVERYGYLKDENNSARLCLEIQKDGYFNSDAFLKQVTDAIDIFDNEFPEYTALFIFDNSPLHKKMSERSLNVNHMNVRPGCKQAVMRATTWNGEEQSMVLPDGTPKGMKLVLEERGFDTSKMKADEMRQTLSKHADFLDQITLVEELINSRGHFCKFFPKFHCELNTIERNWCHAKKHTRAYCNGSIVRLRKIVPEALETVSIELMNKFFATCRLYEKAYREGHIGDAVESAVKQYKSHRRVFS